MLTDATRWPMDSRETASENTPLTITVETSRHLRAMWRREKLEDEPETVLCRVKSASGLVWHDSGSCEPRGEFQQIEIFHASSTQKVKYIAIRIMA
jgi:hypothetical protein